MRPRGAVDTSFSFATPPFHLAINGNSRAKTCGNGRNETAPQGLARPSAWTQYTLSGGYKLEQISIPLGASTLTIEYGKMAKQANGSAFVRYGDTVVLATACSTQAARGNRFLPVDGGLS